MALCLGLTDTMVVLTRPVQRVVTRIGRAWRVVRTRWRVVRGLAMAGLLVVVVVVGYQKRSELASAAGKLGEVRVGWLVVAVAAEIASMVAFGGLHRWLLRAGGVDVSLVSMVEIVMAGNALSSSLPGGAAWSATWSFGQLRRRGADRVLAAWVVVVSGVLATLAVVRDRHRGRVGGRRNRTGVAFALGRGRLGRDTCGSSRWRVRAGQAESPGRTDARRTGGTSARPLPRDQVGRPHCSPAREELATVRPGLLGWAEGFGFAPGQLALGPRCAWRRVSKRWVWACRGGRSWSSTV